MASSAVRHAAVFEPRGVVLDAVQEWKARVGAKWPSAIYLAHPPHATLWAGELERPDAAAESVAAAIAGLTPFTVEIDRPFAFERDALAAGGTTCVWRIAPHDALSELQRCVAEALVSHRTPASLEALPAALRQEPFEQSWLRYGFPFVGRHWIPHVTIAAIPTPVDRAFVDRFLASELSGTIAVNRVTLWRVTGDVHTAVGHWSLGMV